MPHNDGYAPPNKEYEAPPAWDPLRTEAKSWDHHSSKDNDSKPDHSASPSRSLVNEPPREWGAKRDDEKDKSRSRDERDKYWDEGSDLRDDRERSKTREDRPRSEKEIDRDDRGRDRRSDKDREWRRRDDSGDRDRYIRDKDRKEREGSAKDDCERDRGGREDRGRVIKERDKPSSRDDRSDRNDRTRERSISSLKGRRERDRSLDRGSWHERSMESSDVRIRYAHFCWQIIKYSCNPIILFVSGLAKDIEKVLGKEKGKEIEVLTPKPAVIAADLDLLLLGRQKDLTLLRRDSGHLNIEVCTNLIVILF